MLILGSHLEEPGRRAGFDRPCGRAPPSPVVFLGEQLFGLTKQTLTSRIWGGSCGGWSPHSQKRKKKIAWKIVYNQPILGQLSHWISPRNNFKPPVENILDTLVLPIKKMGIRIYWKVSLEVSVNLPVHLVCISAWLIRYSLIHIFLNWICKYVTRWNCNNYFLGH